MAVVSSVAAAVVLTAIAFLHGTGQEPQARSWVVSSVEECVARGEGIKQELLRNTRVRDVRYACIVVERRDNP